MLDIQTDGDGCWPDLRETGFVTGEWVGIARLARGTVKGDATVTVRIKLPDGETLLAETTMALLDGAMAAFRGAAAREAGA
jgi:hypothetical protein